MVVVPDETPLTTPVVDPMVATEVLLLIHIPHAVASLSVVVAPVHTEEAPEMGATASVIVNDVLFQ
jgi:hypothetical protein